MAFSLLRRELLVVATALPVLGCTLDKEGKGKLPDGNTDTGNTGDGNTDMGNMDDGNTSDPRLPQPPFRHKTVLHCENLINLDHPFVFTVTFTATLSGGGQRTNDIVRKNYELQDDMDIMDNTIIDLSESGTVKCKCTIVYEEPGTGSGLMPVDLEVDHTKVADIDLPIFNLTANQSNIYELT
jgi:hypothetical protein